MFQKHLRRELFLIGLLWVSLVSGCPTPPTPSDPCPGGTVVRLQTNICYSPLTLDGGKNELLHGADFNADGLPDLLTGDRLWLTQNNGDFFLAVPSGLLFSPADLNTDSLPDVFTGNQFQLNQGNTQFGPTQNIPFQFQGAAAGVGSLPADLDNDSDLDLVFIGLPNQVAVLLNDGSANFTQTQAFSVPGTALFNGVTLGDFNADSYVDLVAKFDGELLFFLNNGESILEFTPPAIPVPNSFTTVLTTTDVNRDGWLDLALAYFDFDPTLLILLNQTQPNSPLQFDPAQQLFIDRPILALELHDLNNDGSTDLIALQPTINELPNQLSLFFNERGGLFSEPVRVPLDFTPEGLLVDDWNQDNIPDFAATEDSSNRIQLHLLLSQP